MQCDSKITRYPLILFVIFNPALLFSFRKHLRQLGAEWRDTTSLHALCNISENLTI